MAPSREGEETAERSRNEHSSSETSSKGRRGILSTKFGLDLSKRGMP
jgi:hypothetical protein